jgi:hypothetical protein
MRNGPSFWWSNFYDSLVVLIYCCQNQTWSPTLKLVVLFNFHQHSLSIIFTLLQGYIQAELEHLLTTWLNFELLDSRLYAHLECQTWGANHDLQIKVFNRLMNALCCFRQTLPRPKVLTNYLDDNWLCTILFAHLFGGEKFMTTSPLHVKAQRVAFRT